MHAATFCTLDYSLSPPPTEPAFSNVCVWVLHMDIFRIFGRMQWRLVWELLLKYLHGGKLLCLKQIPPRTNKQVGHAVEMCWYLF